ncbi:hypothetical protein FRC03_005053 [Tulasnella sp. 419]|nr:hypothetical protein FRC03_005053 [Tulasnella sp. 419]
MDCLDTLTALMNLATRIKDTFNEARQPGSVIGEMLSKEIFNTLSLIHDLCSSIYIPHVPDATDKLGLLETELNRILIQRENTSRQENRSFLGSLTYALFPDRTNLNEELAQAHLKIQDCYKRLLEKYSTRIGILDRIHSKLEASIAYAEKNDGMAEDLVQISGANSDRVPQLLQDCERLVFLQGDHVSGLEARYLELKLKTLETSMSDNQPGIASTESGNSEATVVGRSSNTDSHRPDVEEDWLSASNAEIESESAPLGRTFEFPSRKPLVEDEAFKDRVLELLRLSNDLRCGMEKSPIKAIPLIRRLIKSINQLGMLEEAADLGEWVVDVFLGVVKSGDNLSKASLVKSRITYIELLIAADRKSLAVDVAGANVVICREVARTIPKQWLPLLADALRYQAIAFHNNNLHSSEGVSLLESIDVHGQHAECDAGPTSFHSFHYQPKHPTSTLALELNKLSKRFNARSRYIDAVDASNASLAIYEKMADTPSSDAPGLAAAYDTLASSLIALRRYEDAISALRKSTYLYRNLADERPATFLIESAKMSRKLSEQHIKLGRYEDSLKVLEDAVSLHQDFIADNIPGQLRDLAACLIIKSSTLSLLSRHDDALAAAMEAVGTYRKVAQEKPTGTLPNLAFSLDMLAWSLHKLGLNTAALPNLDEALQLLSSGKNQIRLNRYKLVREACLKTKAICLSQLNKQREAEQAKMEAAEIASTLETNNSDIDPCDLDEYPLHVSRGLYKLDSPLKVETSPMMSVGNHQKELQAAMEDSGEIVFARGEEGNEDSV